MTFGGGYAMLPILQREVVEHKGWATEEELMDYFVHSLIVNLNYINHIIILLLIIKKRERAIGELVLKQMYSRLFLMLLKERPKTLRIYIVDVQVIIISILHLLNVPPMKHISPLRQHKLQILLLALLFQLVMQVIIMVV